MSAYQAALAGLGQGSPGGQAASPSPPGSAAAGGGVIATVAAAVAVFVLWLRRRRRRRRTLSGIPPSAPPHSVVDAARAAAAGDLRDRAQQELIALGELLEQSGPAGADGTPVPRSGQVEAEADLTRALDAYDAAAQVLDSATGIPDLAGVLVLTHMGRCAASAAQARQTGQPTPPATMLCFFNPLHGEGTRQIRWRARGEHQALEVQTCDACADAVAQRRFPDVLTDTSGTLDVPYYEASSVWAATGYGQFSADDLIRRILGTKTQPGQG